MRKNRVLAIVMAVLMVMTLIPSVVFASAAPSGALDGTLKIKVSADYSKVKPEGITDDLVDFSWSLKDGDLLTEVSTDKNYKIDETAVGLPIVLKITGKEDKGISGSLTATTYEVSETEEEAKAFAERKKEEAKDSGKTEKAADSEDSSSETDPADSADTEAAGETSGETEENSGSQNDSSEETGTDSQEISYSVEITTEDGSGILDFGSAEEGYTVIPDAQYVSIKNTGTGELQKHVAGSFHGGGYR